MSLQNNLASAPSQILWYKKALHVNPLGVQHKICSFDCAYCYLGATTIRLGQIKKDIQLPSIQDILNSTRKLFTENINLKEILEAIVVSGNGEPTLHPELDLLIVELKKFKKEHSLEIPIVIATNGAHLDQRKNIEALNLCDERVIKVDTGNEKTFKKLNAPLSRIDLESIAIGARKLNDLIVQSIFTDGVVNNLGQEELDEWMEVVAMMHPKFVFLDTLYPERKPAHATVKTCENDNLERIKNLFFRKTHIRCKIGTES